MGSTTRIEWTDATWNPVTGCTPCSPGCDHCYAAAMAARFPQVHGYVYMSEADDPERGEPQTFGRVRFHGNRLMQPLHWRTPRRVFVCSMGDLFHPDVPTDWRTRVWDVMESASGHTFQVLTKRPEAMLDYMTWYGHMLPNVWLGVTVCTQAEADVKIPVLLDTPAALRYVSIEPMLGTVDLRQEWFCGFEACRDHGKAPCDHPDCESRRLRWVICGGETGPGARALNADWVRSVRDQCVTAGVPFFFKGRGTATTPKSCCTYRRLDGREWSEIPSPYLAAMGEEQ